MRNIAKQNTHIMKTTVEQTETREWNFPCLGVAPECHIVLFTEFGKGTLIFNPNNADTAGLYSEGWDMQFFTPFKGKLTIEQ